VTTQAEVPKPPKGGYKLQGHIAFQGLRLAIENKKGAVRKGVDKDGKPWRTVMKNPYGYIVGTKSHDDEPVDVYVGPDKSAPEAFVVHQHFKDGTGFDEDKVMLGFESEQAARKAYLEHYNSPKFLGPISAVAVEHLKKLVQSGKELNKITGDEKVAQYLAFTDELARILSASE
jgi:hypothetical protein